MWFKFNTEDFLSVSEELSGTEIGIYVQLLVLSMGKGQARPLALTRFQMLRYCKIQPGNLPLLLNVLDKMFRLTPEGYQPRRELSFFTDTEQPRTDTRKAAAPRKKRPIASGNGATMTQFHAAIIRPTTEGFPADEKARLLFNESRALSARLTGDLSKLPKSERTRETMRRHRDSKALLIQAAQTLGIPATTRWGSKEISAAVVAQLGKNGQLPEPINAQELELLDNERSLRRVQNRLGMVLQQEKPIAAPNDAICVETMQSGEIASSIRPWGEGVGGEGTTSVSSINAVNTKSTDNTVSITRYIPSEKENNNQIGGTAAGAAARAVRQRGIPDANPSHPDLLRLLAQGVTPGELADVAEEAVSRGKGRFAYVLAVTEARRREAAAARPLPGKAMMPSGETVDELDRRIFGED